jgi:O-antigen ligase
MRNPSNLAEGVVVFLICALVVWAPIPLGSNRDWSEALLAAAICITAAIWSILIITGSRPFNSPLQHSKLPIILLVLTQFWVGLQAYLVISEDLSETYRRLLLGVSYTLLFTMVLDIFNTPKRMSWLLISLILSGSLQAFYGTIMVLSGLEWSFLTEKESYRGYATGTFINRNHLAGYLEMTIACGIGFLFATSDGRPLNVRNIIKLIYGPKTIARICIAIMVIGLVMTRSRMGNSAFFVSLLITGILFVLSHKHNRLRNIFVLCSLLTIDVLILSQYFGLDELGNRISSTRITTSSIVDGPLILADNEVRDEAVRDSIPILKDNWRTGIGAGSFEVGFQRYTSADIPQHFNHAHNDLLQFAIEYGALGLFPLAALVIIAFTRALAALSSEESNYRAGVGFCSFMGMLSLMIHSLADFNLQIPSNAMTFVILLAMGCGSQYLAVARKRRSAKHPAFRRSMHIQSAPAL